MSRIIECRSYLTLVLILFCLGNTFAQTKQNSNAKPKTTVKPKPKPVQYFTVSGRTFYQGHWCKGITPTFEEEEESRKIILKPLDFLIKREDYRSQKKIHVYCDQNGYFETQLPAGEYSIEYTNDHRIGLNTYIGSDTLKNLKLEDFINKTERIFGDIKITANTTNLVLAFYQECIGIAE